MTFLHRSTLAIRRIVHKSRARGRRTYTQVSSPVFKVSQSEPVGASRASGSGRPSAGEGWAIPLALAVIGLACSTFSTHQLMNCRDTSRVKALGCSTTEANN